MLSAMEFMGLLLGIAFLAMLASCLMFKILFGAFSDKIRYQMLDKIGTRRQLLKKSIRSEIGVLFIMPGNLLFLFGLFQVLYLLYYMITVKIYSKIVIKKIEHQFH